jgi:hypothetical protein
MELRHLRQLCKTVLLPLLCRAPPAQREAWFSALLPSLLPHMLARLQAQWALLRAPGAAAATAAEVVQERSLREATRSHVQMLQHLASFLEPPSPAWSEMAEAAAQLQPALTTCCLLLTLNDGDAASRASAVLRHMALAVADGRATQLPAQSAAWGEAMAALLQALTQQSNAPHAPDLLQLARDLALRLGGPLTAPAVHSVLCSLPQPPGQPGWAQLEGELRAMRSEKEQRARLRAFLIAAAGCGGGTLAAFAPDGAGKPAASSVTVTRTGPPAERTRRAKAFGTSDAF